jgi:long-subunit acyl-CoA synthetase (AMP-forming)
MQEYIDIVLSLLMMTTPFALISAYSTRFELVHALKVTKATRVFVDAKLLNSVLAAIEDPDVHITPDKIYILSGQPVNGRKSFGQMVDLVMRNKVPLEPVRPAKKDTLAYLLMSSGTSGLPKGACLVRCLMKCEIHENSAVMITHGNDTFSLYQLTVINQLAFLVTSISTFLSKSNSKVGRAS